MVRAKFKCSGKTTDDAGLAQIQMEPVYSGSEENKQFYAWTPGGSIQLGTVNTEAAKQFEIGKEYYVDFTPAN